MNQKLVQLNNNYGVVSDENGNISFIEKENNSYNFKEVLLRENNLEELRMQLENCKDELSLNKQNMKYGNIGSSILVAIEIGIFTFLHSVFPLENLILLGISSYTFFSGILILMCGSRIQRHKKKKELTAAIEKLELELPKLEKELAEIKEKSKYKVNISTIDENKITVKNIYPEISASIDNYIPEKHDMVKVLSLTKKK